MAKSLQTILMVSFLIILFLFLYSNLLTAVKNPTFPTILSKKRLDLKEKLSHLHFYFHESASGKNPSFVHVASSPTSNSSKSLFGTVLVMDDMLTLGPETTSKRVGSAEGIYTFASQSNIALLMAFNFVFSEGKFNGSSLSVLGRNEVSLKEREMPIVGGSGVFRFSRGFAKAKTYSFNTTTFDAIVEYNVFVFHY